jgi:hypothetical protein
VQQKKEGRQAGDGTEISKGLATGHKEFKIEKSTLKQRSRFALDLI